MKFNINKRSKKNFLIISFFVLCLDLFFVGINYYSNTQTLQNSLLLTAKEEQSQFQMTMDMTYRSMMQLALFISQDQSLNQLFLEGKKAVADEGGGSGGKKANAIRAKLLKRVKPAWDQLTKAFDIRQLHYHLGPGSLSFLRVHKPHKFGDRMDNLRHIIVDTNKEKTPRFGFETGRIYSGLRGVYPIWATDQATGKKTFAGSLEVGTSFKQILPSFSKNYGTDISILLTKNHVESKMWKKYINEYFQKNPHSRFYLEATSSDQIHKILSKINIASSFQSKKVHISKINNQYYSIYYYPLYDYQVTSNKNNNKASGVIVLWHNISNIIQQFKKNFYINLLFSAFAFIAIEIVLLIILIKEQKYREAQRQAIYDGLTEIYNRRYFDLIYNNAKSNLKNNSMHKYAIILIDIDNFKSYNDHYGHQAGDNCLKKVAKSIDDSVRRNSDFVCRYGGEEFVVLMTDATKNTALETAETIRKNIEKLKLVHEKSKTRPFVTISAGIGFTDAEQDTDVLKQADESLYKAKENGRNQIAFAN